MGSSTTAPSASRNARPNPPGPSWVTSARYGSVAVRSSATTALPDPCTCPGGSTGAVVDVVVSTGASVAAGASVVSGPVVVARSSPAGGSSPPPSTTKPTTNSSTNAATAPAITSRRLRFAREPGSRDRLSPRAPGRRVRSNRLSDEVAGSGDATGCWPGGYQLPSTPFRQPGRGASGSSPSSAGLLDGNGSDHPPDVRSVAASVVVRVRAGRPRAVGRRPESPPRRG